MSNQSTIKEWTTVAFRQSTLDKINRLLKSHKEFGSAAEFVDQAVVLQLNKYEVANK